MLTIYVTLENQQYTFRTNDSGAYLFIGAQNRQLSTKSGFNSLKHIKKEIRKYLQFMWEYNMYRSEPMPKLKYKTYQYDSWKK